MTYLPLAVLDGVLELFDLSGKGIDSHNHFLLSQDFWGDAKVLQI